jgi:8-amino-7-oxononanoate synthase
MKNKTIFDRIENYTIAKELQETGLYPYFREIISEQSTEVELSNYKNKKILMFGSNSYLGLTYHPKVKEASINAVKKYGTGCGGSRFLNGTLDLHIELEEALASFVNKEAALLYSTGFMVNQGVLSTIVRKGDYILSDKYNHASIIDGCFLSSAKMIRYNHNDPEDLEKKLSVLSKNEGGLLIVTDGVFSMEGDIAKLPEIVELAEKYGAMVMVDDAHSLGVLGKIGDGTASHFNISSKVDLIMGTFSKSLASVGGFIAGDKDVIHFLQHNSRAHIFSASMPPASAAAALEALKIIIAEPERIEKLWDNTNRMKQGLLNIGFNLGDTETPIIPVIIGDMKKTFLMSKMLEEEGIFVNSAAPPAVPPNRSLIRLSLMSTHTFEQIDYALEKLEQVAKKLGVI